MFPDCNTKKKNTLQLIFLTFALELNIFSHFLSLIKNFNSEDKLQEWILSSHTGVPGVELQVLDLTTGSVIH